METIDVVVIGGRRDRPGVGGGHRRGRAARSACSSAIPRPGHGHEHAQQRRHPRRPLLPAGLAEGQALRRGRARAVRVLRAARRASRPLRQAHRRPATSGEAAGLEALKAQGEANGVEGLEIVDADGIRRREPHAAGVAALFSPDTGRRRARGARARARAASSRTPAATCCRHAPRRRRPRAGRHRCSAPSASRSSPASSSTRPGCSPTRCRRCSAASRSRIHPCRGEYAELAPSRSAPGQRAGLSRSRTPSGHGLGVHLTKTTWGSVLVGPTVRHQDSRHDYETGRMPLEASSSRRGGCCRSSRSGTCRLGGSGIRPNLNAADERFADFLIRRDRVNPRVVQAAGINSPGLTACLAVGTDWSRRWWKTRSEGAGRLRVRSRI